MDGATCGGEIDGRGSRAALGGRWGGVRGRAGAGGGTAVSATRPMGGDLWDTARSPRTPIASPSYPRQLRYT